MEDIFIFAGAVTALIIFVFIVKKIEGNIKLTAIYGISLLASLVISEILLKLISVIISNHNGYLYEIVYSFYLTMILFLVISAIFAKVYGIDREIIAKTAVVPLLAFLTVAKTGCFFNGCCFAEFRGVFIPLNLIEAILSLSVMIFILSGKIKPSLYLLILYSVFRLITDFYKDSFKYENIDGIAVSQIVYIAVILFAAGLIILNKKRGKTK